MAVLHWIFQMNNVPKNRFGFASWQQIERDMYSKYVPLPKIMMKAKDFIMRYNICDSASVHIRLTDLNDVLPPRKRISIDAFHRFVESQATPVFLMTDNPQTQKLFLKVHGRFMKLREFMNQITKIKTI